jgi:hypothetical protein
MMNFDKIIDEANKELVYGPKPKLPEKLEKQIYVIEKVDGFDAITGYRAPTNSEIVDTVNKIIEYLEWEGK